VVVDSYRKVPIPYTRIRELNVWTLSNFLSLLRVLLLPFIYLSLIQQTESGDRWAIGLMVLAALTDIFDGWIARIRHTISSFGKIIDPLADKICMVAVALFLVPLRGFPVWLLILMLARDAAIMLVSAMLIRRYKIVFPSNIWGKLYSFSVALLIAAYTLHFRRRLIFQLQTLVIVMILISSLSYTVIITRYIKTHYRHQRKGRIHKAASPKGRPNPTASSSSATESQQSRR